MLSSNSERQRKGGRAVSTAITVVVAVVAGFGGGLAAYSLKSPSTTSTTTTAPSSAASVASSCAVTSIATKVLPSVVTISAYGPAPAGGGQGSGDTGSGEIIRAGGYIVTNNHVVSVAASGGSVSVLFSDGVSTPATIVGRDPLTDLAVVKVDVSHSLPVLPLGSSATVQIGEPVVVLGAPLGLSSTVTSGIISARDRTINVPGENGRTAVLINALQTDAAINPGNSGGAMVNCSGELIGVPSAGATVPNESGQSNGGSIGLGFAIPVDVLKPIVSQIISTGKVTHSYLGVDAEPILPGSSSQSGATSGLLITYVVPNSPTSQAGIQVGDVLTTVNGKKLTTTDQLVEILLTQKPGTKIEVGYVRDGKQATTEITLGAQPS